MPQPRWFVTPFAALLLLASSTAHAAAPDGALRIYAAQFGPTGAFSGPIGPSIDTRIEGQSAGGLGVGYELAVSDRVGLQADVLVADVTFDLSAAGGTTELGSAVMVPMTFAAQWHLTDSERVDAFVGPLFAFTVWGNLESSAGVSETETDFGFGARAGLDLLFGESWALSAQLTYLTTAAGDSSLTIDVDPLIAAAGLTYRF